MRANRRRRLIVGRTDAAAVEDLDRAIERGRLYAEAGADILFIEAPRTRDDLAKVAKELGGTAPLLANMVEGGNTPLLTRDELAGIGFRIVIFPGGIVRALARTARDYYASLQCPRHECCFSRPDVRLPGVERHARNRGDLEGWASLRGIRTRLACGLALRWFSPPQPRRRARRLPTIRRARSRSWCRSWRAAARTW